MVLALPSLDSGMEVLLLIDRSADRSWLSFLLSVLTPLCDFRRAAAVLGADVVEGEGMVAAVEAAASVISELALTADGGSGGGGREAGRSSWLLPSFSVKRTRLLGR